MPKSMPIVIACPELRKAVRGTYPCDPSGHYKVRGDGALDLALVTCGQDGGRCTQTLCALHRYNRRGPGTWYPDSVQAMPESPTPRRQPPDQQTGGPFDQLC